jgi:DNA-binding MarR family transcriptional regulator
MSTEPAHGSGRRTLRDARFGAWRAFLEAHARVSRRLDEELRAAHGLSLAEYDALVQLAETGSRRMRMNQLAERVLLSRSGVTRLIDRLVADGLVTRSACTTDARGAEAVLTDRGLDRLRAATPIHLRGVRRYFLEVVEPGDFGAIDRALGAVARNACGEGEHSAECAIHDVAQPADWSTQFDEDEGAPPVAPLARQAGDRAGVEAH